MMDMQMGGLMGGFMILWGLIALALLVFLVVATIWLLVNMTSRRRDGGGAPSSQAPPQDRQ